MELNPTQRFSARVDDYVRYRPSYPRGVVNLLERECGFAAASRVADAGSGTGLLARLFLEAGCAVYGVEPNAEMRAAGERFLAAYPRFHSIDGLAEATTLPDSSVDFVTAGQAFHWFDSGRARAEFARILKPEGWVVLVWNERRPATEFMQGYEALVTRFGPERPRVADAEFDRFFGAGGWRSAKLPNSQRFDYAGLCGRFLSSSYAPLPGSAGHAELLSALDGLFERHQQDGHVTLLYDTEVYLGRPRA